ncbi:hypothetical protein P9112_001624 [Eukaryota sp. TZLM1-RC]
MLSRALSPLDLSFEPKIEDITKYAEYLGIDPVKEKDLMWIAKEGINAPVPPGWSIFRDDNRKIYYFHHETRTSQWEHPSDHQIKARVHEERSKRRAASPFSNMQKEKQKMKVEYNELLKLRDELTELKEQLQSEREALALEKQQFARERVFDDYPESPTKSTPDVQYSSSTRVQHVLKSNDESPSVLEWKPLQIKRPPKPSSLPSIDILFGQNK